MSVGSAVRRALGPVERPISSAYRAMFLDVAALGREMCSVPFGPRVLEIGVGDGLVAAQLVARRPDVEVLGIDLIDAPGTLYDADSSRVEFRTQTTADLVALGGAAFDAVVLSDVLHHVPPAQRTALLSDVSDLLAPDGVLLIKETVVVRSPGYWMGRFSDRWISADREVSFLTERDLRSLVEQSVDRLELVRRATIRPWSTNVLLAWRRQPVSDA